MARFGVFTNAGQLPIQTFDADYMTQEGAFIKFFKNAQTRDDNDSQVGAANLGNLCAGL
jgi:hypothetical protein